VTLSLYSKFFVETLRFSLRFAYSNGLFTYRTIVSDVIVSRMRVSPMHQPIKRTWTWCIYI